MKNKVPQVSRALLLLTLIVGAVVLVALPGAGAAVPAPGLPVSQCNDQADTGATSTTCDITITNVITYNADGTSTTASTIVTTVDGVPNTTTATSPITEIHQCNRAGKGGAATVTCTSTITNMITGAPASGPAGSTINQCNPVMGSTMTCTATPAGPNATGGYQAIDQCNNSGATGTVTCTATAGVASDSAPRVAIDQCNGSATTGASTLTCTATVTNTFACVSTSTLLANGACFTANASTTSTVGGTTSTTGLTLTIGAPTTTSVVTTTTSAGSTPATGNVSPPTTVAPGGGTTATPGGATLVSSSNPSALGQVVVFTFTLVRPGSPITGNVTFFDGPTRLGTVLLAGGQATFAISNLAPGDHAITARFAEAGSNSAIESAAIRQTVTGGASAGDASARTRSGLAATGGGTASIGVALGLFGLLSRFALRRTVGSPTQAEA